VVELVRDVRRDLLDEVARGVAVAGLHVARRERENDVLELRVVALEHVDRGLLELVEVEHVWAGEGGGEGGGQSARERARWGHYGHYGCEGWWSGGCEGACVGRCVGGCFGGCVGWCFGWCFGWCYSRALSGRRQSMQLRCCGGAAEQLAWMLEVAHDWEGAGSGGVAWRGNHSYDQ
jgi:hypothetical protein